MKKITAVFLAVLILITVTSVSAFAQPKLRPIEEVIREAIVNFEDSVDVSAYGYDARYGGPQRLYETVYFGVYQTYADTFHYDASNVSMDNFVYNNDTALVEEYKLNYIYTPEEVKMVKDLAEEYIFSKIGKDWSDLEKALFFHDYLCQNFQYDIRLFFEETQNDVARDIYRMFNDGMGVCQAYANAYEYLLQHEGIECKLVASDYSNHEWNIIKLDNQWYHVDVTQDDPLVAINENSVALLDMAGSVSHKYFLLSDNGIYDHHYGGDHYNWYCTDDINREKTIPCSSAKYENGWLFNESKTAFCYVDNNWYYFRHNAEDMKAELVKTADFKTDTIIKVMDSLWDADEPGYCYNEVYAGLSEVNGYLIYNTDDEIYAYNVKDNTEKILFTLNQIRARDDIMEIPFQDQTVIPQNAHIYGSKADKDGVYCQISQKPSDFAYYAAIIPTCDYIHPDSEWFVTKEATGWSDGLEERKCLLCRDVLESRVLPATGSGFPKGDVNFDGEVNIIDLAMLKKAVAGIEEKIDLDLSGDGKTDIVDLAVLKKFVAGLSSAL